MSVPKRGMCRGFMGVEILNYFPTRVISTAKIKIQQEKAFPFRDDGFSSMAKAPDRRGVPAAPECPVR